MPHSLHMLSCFLKVPQWLTRSGAACYSDPGGLMHAPSGWQPILRVQLPVPLCNLQTFPRVQWGACWLRTHPGHPLAFATTPEQFLPPKMAGSQKLQARISLKNFHWPSGDLMLIVLDIPALKPRDGWDREMYTFQKCQVNEGKPFWIIRN